MAADDLPLEEALEPPVRALAPAPAGPPCAQAKLRAPLFAPAPDRAVPAAPAAPVPPRVPANECHCPSAFAPPRAVVPAPERVPVPPLAIAPPRLLNPGMRETPPE
ncbi:MAG TPA: hypothetical protein VEG64_14415 [Candidatus Sulfotelmatobacter sp.]|nr:hypothetical protein [Candidatus Sulfotelmatobacter sp.]